jgi:hypothetical protein
MKCAICNAKIETTFLNKLVGTFIGKGKKKKAICSNCQKTNSKEELTTKLA